MMTKGKLITTVGLVFVALASLLVALAANAEDARVLPQGRSRMSFVYGKSFSISQSFNSSGEKESILGRYGAESLKLSSGNLKRLSPEVAELVSLLNATGRLATSAGNTSYLGLTRDPNAPLLGDSLTLGSLFAEAEAERSIQAISFQYGLTSHISVGLMVPFVKNKVNVNYGFSGNRNVGEVLKIVNSNDFGFQEHQRAVELLNAVDANTFQDILKERGYQRFEDYEGGGIGDVALGGRYNYLDARYRAGKVTNSFQSFLTLPTGTTRPTSALTELGTGSGTVDLATAHITNFSPRNFLTLSNSIYYTRRFANHAPVRVRTSEADILPDASTEELLSQKLGDKYWTNFGAKFQVSEAFSLDVSYEFFWKARDHYEGPNPERDYSYLNETSDSAPSNLQTLQLGASVSSIPGFLRSELPLPLDFSMNFYLPRTGKNAMIAPYGTAELALYF